MFQTYKIISLKVNAVYVIVARTKSYKAYKVLKVYYTIAVLVDVMM